MRTRYRYSIRSRLQWSMAAIIASLVALSGVFMLLLVFWFESTLFYNHLESDLESYIHAYSSVSEPMRERQSDTTFYKLPSLDHPLLPAAFHDYSEGNFEIIDGAKAYHLFVRYRSPWVYALVQDQSEFERYEILAVTSVILGSLLIAILGFLLSRLFAVQILRPVLTLAHLVERKSKVGQGAAIDPEIFPNDEIGLLAAAIKRYDVQVAALLEREKQFTADVSHELRNPMMVIQAATDLLRETADQSSTQGRVIARIDRAVENMRHQTALYLQLAREPDKLDCDASLCLLEAAEAAMDHWRGSAESKGLTLSLAHIDKQETARVPALLIGAVLKNLLQNAVNHTENGSITLEVSSRSVAVKDTGSGIDPDIAEHIFQRGVRSRRGPESGYGIGLSIVKRICDHQGWEICATPNPPQGTVFTLTVPHSSK